MKWFGIINPVSGGKKSDSHLNFLIDSLEKITATYDLTRFPGHAETLARQSSDFDGIIVIGGDGTLFEVLKGMNIKRQFLAIIPSGTGNSLARDLSINSIACGFQAINANNAFSADLLNIRFTNMMGVSTQCYSASTIGIGYIAHTVETGNKYFKSLGRYCYPLSATVTSIFKKPFSVMLNYNNGYNNEKLLTGLLINNTRHSGNFLAFPDASIDDGGFDILELNAGLIKQNLYNISVLTRTYFFMPLTRNNIQFLSVSLQSPQSLMIDGEIFPDIIDVCIKVMPRVLKCYKNAKVDK